MEVKHRKWIPKWILDAMSQSVGAARDGQTPLVIVHGLNTRHDNDLVIVRLRDWEELYGTVGTTEVEEA